MDKTQVVMEEANGVLDFWFGELSPEQWFKEDAALDKTITSRFSKLRAAAIKGELWPWRATATGRLAEIILLDQFSRNIHRNDKDAFSADSIALVLAQEAVSVEADKVLTPQQRAFLYMAQSLRHGPACRAARQKDSPGAPGGCQRPDRPKPDLPRQPRSNPVAKAEARAVSWLLAHLA